MAIVQRSNRVASALASKLGPRISPRLACSSPGRLSVADLLSIALSRPVYAYWWDGMNNFGDLITEAVLCWLGAKKVRNVYSSSLDRGPALVGAGSILDRLQYPSAVVWGSGFMMGGIPDESAKPAEPMEVVALRGPRSRDIAKQLGWKSTELFCDPGLLLSMMYKPGDKKYEVGFVPHYWHAKSARTSDYTGSVKVIDVLQSVPSVVAELTSCKVVISTSLHGVIAAHSFGIPWVWAKMEPALIGDYFKFYDFMEGMGISAQPVSLAPEEVEEETLLRLAKGARLPEGQNIAEKQRSLLTGLRDCTTLRNLPRIDELPNKHKPVTPDVVPERTRS